MRNESLDASTDNSACLLLFLDVELAWGVVNTRRDIFHFLKKRESVSRDPIDFLLRVLERHDIACTWAVVGHLFLSRCERHNGIPHRDIPRCTENWYSVDPCSDLSRDPLFYGKDIIENIISNPVEHEIGYHSFSHVILSQCTEEVARAEIAASKGIGKEFGIEFKSFVFPRNEVGHVNLLKEFGFRIFRGGKIGRWRENQRFLTRKRNGIADRLSPMLTGPINRQGIWEIPTCIHFWNPASPAGSLLQAKRGIRKVIKEKRILSIYLHPWELLWRPSLKGKFETLLGFASRMRDDGKLSILTMSELSTVLEGCS